MGYGDHYTRPNLTLVDQIVALGEDGYLTAKSMAQARRLREAQSKAWNQNYELPVNTERGAIAGNLPFLALDQAAVGLTLLG